MTTVIADGGYRGTGLVIPHRRERGQAELPDWKEDHNRSHCLLRTRTTTSTTTAARVPEPATVPALLPEGPSEGMGAPGPGEMPEPPWPGEISEPPGPEKSLEFPVAPASAHPPFHLLRRSVLAEAAVAMVVLALTTLLTSTVPELRVTLTLTGRHVGPLDTHVTGRGGYWSADSFVLPTPEPGRRRRRCGCPNWTRSRCRPRCG